MIDEEKTFKNFGYYSTELKPRSNKKIIVICDNCGKERVVAKHDYTDLCRPCVHIGIKRPDLAERNRKNKGGKSPAWNPNKTDEEREIGRSYPEYTEWRKNIYERDDYVCQICGNKGGVLNAHHIEGYAKNPEFRIILENGITLCKDCHNNFHHKYGRYNNTKKQLIELIESYKI